MNTIAITEMYALKEITWGPSSVVKTLQRTGTAGCENMRGIYC